MTRILLLFLLFLPAIELNAGPACALGVQPRMALEPLRFIRIRVTIEGRDGGLLELVGETSSLIQPGPKTTWVEWKNVLLPAGDYEVLLRTPSKCAARETIHVAGGNSH